MAKGKHYLMGVDQMLPLLRPEGFQLRHGQVAERDTVCEAMASYPIRQEEVAIGIGSLDSAAASLHVELGG